MKLIFYFIKEYGRILFKNGHREHSDLFRGIRLYKATPSDQKKSVIQVTKDVISLFRYWNAFPELEIELLKRGYHLVHVKNHTRLANRDDCDRKSRFIEYVSKTYDLDCRCILVGMSCGGAQAVNFASYYPQYVACLFIDAPVLNFLDWPGRYNDAKCEGIWEAEFKAAYPGVKRCDIFKLAENPINNVHRLIEEKFQVIMLYGTEDMTVNYNSVIFLYKSKYLFKHILSFRDSFSHFFIN